MQSPVPKNRGPETPASVNYSQARKTRCLILACGNTLREDDGVGPWLAEWAEQRFGSTAGLRVISRLQWTPELAEDIAQAEGVLFIDCARDSEPGVVRIAKVEQGGDEGGIGTHHLDARGLLRLADEFYGARPRTSLLLTIGAGSTELREGFSELVEKALPEACALLKNAVDQMLHN